MTRRGLSYRQVRRRQVGAFAVMIADVVVFCVGMPMLSARVGGAGALALLVVFFAVLLGAVVVGARAKTLAARRALQTGEVPELPEPAPLLKELEGLRAQYGFLLFMAVSTAVLMPLGAAGAYVRGTAVVPAVSWTTVFLLLVVVAAAFWARWLWRRRVNVVDALEELTQTTP